jgi:hypothetical protein
MTETRDAIQGLNGERPTSYREFWPYYLSQHLHPMTQRVHAAGTATAFTLGISSLLRGRWKFFAAAPLFAYVPAIASHFIWEGNRPVLFGGNFWWAARADVEMVFKVFTGRIGQDVAALRETLGLEPAETTLADRDRLRPAA